MDERRVERRPARRPRRRRRLLDVLPAAQDGGARRRALQRGGARVRGGDLRPGRARLRPHGDDRDGRHVPRRQRRLPVVRPSARSSSSRVAVLGSVTVLPAVLSKLGDKVEKGRVPFVGKRRHTQPRRVARRGAGSSTACSRRPVVSLVARRRPPGRARHPGARACTRSTRASRASRTTSTVMKTYDRIQAAFPGGPLPAVVVVQADDVTTPEVQARHQGDDATSALATGQMSEPVTHRDQPGQDGRGRLDRRWTATAPTRRPRRRSPTLRDDVIPATIGQASTASRPT